MGGFFFGLVKGLFATIDKIVVWFVETLYDLLFQISNVQIFTNNDISAFASRITVILTIFMLFKLSFSFLNYIINPDNMTDKSKGFSKIIQNVAVSLVLLVSYQFVFDKAMELQQKIIDNETIPKLILGNNVSAGTGVKNPGTLSFALFSAFVTPNSTIDNCDNYATLENPSASCDLSDYTGGVTNYTSPRGELISGTNPIVINEQFDMIVKYKDTHALFGHMVAWKKGEIFAFDYWFIISTACGVFAGLILLSFCFDIAVRTIKLGFYRLIAPIPIISYIDPNKGEGVFKKWLSNVGKTYADLFIRLIAIYFAIYIIQLVVGGVGTGLRDLNDQPINNPLVIVFIIIGALMFAKQFPKLIQDITGMSFDSKLELNPLKKIRDNALGGKQLVAGAAGAVGAGLTGLGNMAHRVSKFNKNVATEGGGLKGFVKAGGLTEGFKILGSGIAGTTSGFWNTTKNAYSSGKVVEGVKKGIETANTHRTEREIGHEEGATTLGILGAKVADKMGFETRYQRMKRQVENVKSVKSSVDNLSKDLENEIYVKGNLYESAMSKKYGVDSQKYKDAVAFISGARDAKTKVQALQNVDIQTIRKDAATEYDTRLSSATAQIDSFNANWSTYTGLTVDVNTTDAQIAQAFGNSQEALQATQARDAMRAATAQTKQQAIEKAEQKHNEEIRNAQQKAYDAGEVAKEYLFRGIMNGEFENVQIKSEAEAISRVVEKSTGFDENEKYKYSGSSYKDINDQAKADNNRAITVENSEEYRTAQANHVNANLGENSYNNRLDTHATKQKNS